MRANTNSNGDKVLPKEEDRQPTSVQSDHKQEDSKQDQGDKKQASKNKRTSQLLGRQSFS